MMILTSTKYTINLFLAVIIEDRGMIILDDFGVEEPHHSEEKMNKRCYALNTYIVARIACHA